LATGRVTAQELGLQLSNPMNLNVGMSCGFDDFGGLERIRAFGRRSTTCCTRRITPESAISASLKQRARISNDELLEAAHEKSAAIEIQEFVSESQIPTLYFEKPYYLEPDPVSGPAVRSP
jgi:hypothetical protein